MEEMYTSRLRIRPLLKEDTDAVHALATQKEVARYMRFSVCRSREDTGAVMREYLGQNSRSFAIEEGKNGRFCGVFAFKKEENTPEERAEWGLSTFTDPTCWNRGYAGEILARMIPYAREVLHAAVLTAHVIEDNMGSRRVLEKQGFEVREVLHFPDLSSGLYVYALNL